MPLFDATWRVTHAGSVVLLDADDRMNDEPKLDGSYITDSFAALQSQGVVSKGRNNVSHTASFSRVRVFESDQEAREFMRTHDEDIQAASVVEQLEIEWLGQFTGTTLTNCTITGYRSRCENNWFVADYTVRGGIVIPNQVEMISAAGNTDITPDTPFTGVYIVGVGSGSYTRTISLLAGTNEGDTVDVYIWTRDTETIEVRDLTSGGTLLFTATGEHSAYRAVWDGSHWIDGTFATSNGTFFFS